MKGKKILVGITGGISSYKICNLVRLFVKAGAEVKIIMTPSATKFVSPLTLSVLSRNDVVINTFPDIDDYSKAEKSSLSTWHINYGLWADVFVIAPATTNTIAKIEAGICDNFLLCTVFAARCPIVLVPSMDEDMYNHRITQRNIESLKKNDFSIINPVYGELASGLIGMGKMPEPEDIYQYINRNFFTVQDFSGKKVLVTAGPTREPFDPVRFISNYSSGKMGFEIANAAFKRGADVTLISGPVALKESEGIKRININSADDMFDEVKKCYRKQDIIIMASAVSDFKPIKISGKKIKKENKGNLKIEFVKNPDILKFLGENKKKFKLIGFALETDNELKNAREKFLKKNLDLIVLNNPNEEGAGFEKDTNVVTFIAKNSSEKLPLMTKSELANQILSKIKEIN
jgi:phosphopantothenoylcysteine decarboxylase/phosphopantothenate--cysteine ligase